MNKCVICGREIDENTHLIINSHGKDINFYSKNCVNEFIKKAESISFNNESTSFQFEKEKFERPRIYLTLRQEIR